MITIFGKRKKIETLEQLKFDCEEIEALENRFLNQTFVSKLLVGTIFIMLCLYPKDPPLETSALTMGTFAVGYCLHLLNLHREKYGLKRRALALQIEKNKPSIFIPA